MSLVCNTGLTLTLLKYIFMSIGPKELFNLHHYGGTDTMSGRYARTSSPPGRGTQKSGPEAVHSPSTPRPSTPFPDRRVRVADVVRPVGTCDQMRSVRKFCPNNGGKIVYFWLPRFPSLDWVREVFLIVVTLSKALHRDWSFRVDSMV